MLTESSRAMALRVFEDLGFAGGQDIAPFDDEPPTYDTIPEGVNEVYDIAAGGPDQAIAPAVPKLPWLDMSAFDGAPLPEREWAIRDRVPLKQAGLFSGEGGTGKSIIELQKNVAHVMGRDWLGSMPELGPAFYIGAEDDKNEIHIRLAAIAKHYGATFKDLTAGGLHVLPLLGQDATLCAVNPKTGRVEVTGLYRKILEAAGDIKPNNISIDTLSRAFAGNVSHELIDDLAGLQSGYTSKLLAPEPMKGLGPMSLPALLGALGAALVLVEDSAQAERVRDRWTPRKRPPRGSD